METALYYIMCVPVGVIVWCAGESLMYAQETIKWARIQSTLRFVGHVHTFPRRPDRLASRLLPAYTPSRSELWLHTDAARETLPAGRQSEERRSLMRVTTLMNLAMLLLGFCGAPVVMATDPAWICCAYTCTTDSGQTHDTHFCHPSSIGATCPALPAQSEHAEQCELVAENAANTCQECVNGLH
jgi:hypothetical protein